MKKFCEQFFLLSKVQHIRKQVINFAQGEEEGIDQAWDRFNGLIEQGPKLGFSGEVLLHTFYFFPNPRVHAVCSNVCRRRSHGENTHGSRPTPTKNQQGCGHAKRLGKMMFGKLRGRISSAGACWNFQKRDIGSEGRTTEAWESHRDEPR